VSGTLEAAEAKIMAMNIIGISSPSNVPTKGIVYSVLPIHSQACTRRRQVKAIKNVENINSGQAVLLEILSFPMNIGSRSKVIR